MTRIDEGSPGAIEVAAAVGRLLAAAQDAGLSGAELDALLGVAPGACADAARRRATLSAAAETRARRLAGLIEAGATLLGGREQVGLWLRLPNLALDGTTPLDALLGDPRSLAAIRNAVVAECREAYPGCGL